MSSRGDHPRRQPSCSGDGGRRKRSTLTSRASCPICPPAPPTCFSQPCGLSLNNNSCESEPVDEGDCDEDPCVTYYGDLILWGFIGLLILTVLIGLWGSTRWNQKTPDANLALATMGACITTNVEGLTCTRKQKVDDPTIIISGQPVMPGSAFCYHGQGDFLLSLSTPAYVTGFTYEHVPKDAHPEKHIESAPKLFVLNGITTNSNDQPVEMFLGNFEYLDNGHTTQSFYFDHPNLETKFSEVKVSILGNHGHRFTCVYRIQIHGKIRLDSDKIPSSSEQKVFATNAKIK